MPVLLVGGGRMGQALLGGWLKASAVPRIAIVEPHPAPELLRLVDQQSVTLGFEELPRPLTVVMAVKPQILDAVAPDYAALAGPDVTFLSIVAGKTLRRLAAYWGPDAAIIRSMPNLAAQVGRGITVAVANDKVDAPARRAAQSLLEAVGAVEWVAQEALIDAVTAVSGSGPAYVFLLVECLAKAAVEAGLDEELAMRLARTTIEGAAEVLRQSRSDAAALRAAVTSPKGTTAAALEILMAEHGLAELLSKAVAAAAQRSRDLAD